MVEVVDSDSKWTNVVEGMTAYPPEQLKTLLDDAPPNRGSEAPYYIQTDTRLAAPLLNTPFTHGEIGVLMKKGQGDLLQLVNDVICQMKQDGTLRLLHEKYGLVYAY